MASRGDKAGRASAPHAGRGARTLRSVAAACAAIALAAPAPASRRTESELLADDAPMARAAVRVQYVDFAPGDGETVIGITASSPLTNHTAYESDAQSLVIEIPDADVSQLQPSLPVGTAQVESLGIEARQQGSSTIARFVIRRAAGSRRSVSLDPKNPNRLLVTIRGASLPETPQVAAASAPVVAAPAPRVLATASAPAARPEPQPAATTERVEAPAATSPVPVPVPRTAAASPTPRPVDRATFAGGATAAPSPGAGMGATAPVRSGPARLVGASVETADDGRTVVRLQANGPLEAKAFVLDDPPRVAIDLVGTINAVPEPSLPARAADVKRVRISQYQPLPSPVTRVVVDLAEATAHEVMTGPDAIVVAFGRASSGAPAMASAGRFRLDEPVRAPANAASLVSLPVTASATTAGTNLANLGRPSTLSGDAPPAIDPSAGLLAPPPGRMRETANGALATASGRGGVSTEGTRFEAVRVNDSEQVFTGEPISISVKDADLQDLFRLFHQVSGLNIVVDPAVRGKTITLELRDVPWDQAMDLVLRTQGLGQSLEGNVLRIAPLPKLAAEEQQQKQLEEARENAGTLEQIAFPLSYAQGSTAEPIVRKNLSPRGDVQLDRRTNTLIIRDLPARLDEVRSLLDLLDQPTRQVMIEARIVETTLDFSKAVGINWGFTYIADRAFGTETGFAFPRSIVSDYAVNLPVAASNAVLGLSFRNILNTFALDLAISSLEDRGRARIISRPMVMVQNNEPAEIESGVQIPITNTTATETDVTFVSASLRLSVTPQITADNNVIMQLRVENNAPVFIQSVGDNASIATRQARTTVAVPDGGTTVIGGIYQVNEGNTSNRVPFLSRIPLLGWLFRNKTIDRTNDELLIFLTPRIQRA